MMLGINAPKPLVKGEFAKAVRKAVHDSMVQRKIGRNLQQKVLGRLNLLDVSYESRILTLQVTIVLIFWVSI
jgi:hypothetical protein